MSKQDNGGPAFPISIPGVGDNGAFGMTLRDYFAAKWLQGWMANPSTSDLEHADAAKFAYVMADAMLAERAKEQA